jgi:hypothetical protein
LKSKIKLKKKRKKKRNMSKKSYKPKKVRPETKGKMKINSMS